MPTPEEIKSIAHEYGVLLAKDIPLSNCLKNEVINSTEDYIVDFLQHLSKTHCIVPKSKIKDEYEIAEKVQYSTNPEDKMIGKFAQTLILRLFGTALFNEEKE